MYESKSEERDERSRHGRGVTSAEVKKGADF